MAATVGKQCQRHLQSAAGLRVDVREAPGPCPMCGRSMAVQKTLRRRGRTLAHGAFDICETVHTCPAGCRQARGVRVTQRAATLRQCLPVGQVFGYDVIVYVGRERFLRHRQREEIREALAADYGITLSTGTISTLAARFLDFLAALHAARAPALAAALQADGGWPLHVDATSEDGRGTWLVLLAGWRRWVLGAAKIPTERAAAIGPCLHEVANRFGEPCAVMRDLGKGMILAVADFVAARGLSIPVLSCHFHFLQDVGKDLLGAAYGRLRDRLRQARIKPHLRALARDLGRTLGTDIAPARAALAHWKTRPADDPRLPDGPLAGLAVVRGLAQWVLDFPADSTDRRFPFDRPLLDLYDRSREVGRAVAAFLRHPPKDGRVRRALGRLAGILKELAANSDMLRQVRALRQRVALFEELRGILRLRAPATAPGADPAVPARGPAAPAAPAELRDIEQELRQWQGTLRAPRPAGELADDQRQAIGIVLDHLDRYGASLFGHLIALPAHLGGGVRVVDRTNNLEESFFRTMKHRERRRSGRKVLTQDFERLPPAAALVANLEKPDYVALLCGTLDALPAAFAELDACRQDAPAAGGPVAAPAPVTDGSVIETTSLPAADRRLIRSAAMTHRIRAAARSRAPRIRQVG
jgi:hypothetical protein